MPSVTPRPSSDSDETAAILNTSTISANEQTAAAINDDSSVSGFNGRTLTKAIDESGEELSFGLSAKPQNNRLGTSENKTPATTVWRTKQETVFVRADFDRVGDIDTAKESFWASVTIRAKWREPELDSKLTLKPEHVTWSDYWNPEIYIGNYLGNAKKEDIVSRDLMFQGDHAYFIETHQLTGAFHEKLELQKFPFDIQKFKVVILSKLSTNDVLLTPDVDQTKSVINTEAFEDKQEWRLYSNVSLDVEDEDELPDENHPLSRQLQNRPQLLATSTASRRYEFYLMNFMFTTLFITCMSFCTFSIDHVKVENRLQVTFILLLTTVAFKNTVNSFLPRYSYLTYLDIYILTSMILIGCGCIWHAVVGTLKSFRNDFWVDKAILTLLASVYAIFNATYVSIYVKARIARRKLKQKELAYVSQLDTEVEPNGNTTVTEKDWSENVAVYRFIETRA